MLPSNIDVYLLMSLQRELSMAVVFVGAFKLLLS